MRYLAIAFMFIITNLIAFSQEVQICSEISRDRERGECYYRQLKKEDRLLNTVYSDARKILDDENKELLKKTQLAWISYKEADCEQLSAPFTGGTLFSEIQTKCLLKKTKQRIEEIRALEDAWSM